MAGADTHFEGFSQLNSRNPTLAQHASMCQATFGRTDGEGEARRERPFVGQTRPEPQALAIT